eukprot:1001742-Prymnesium_polylepis.1
MFSPTERDSRRLGPRAVLCCMNTPSSACQKPYIHHVTRRPPPAHASIPGAAPRAGLAAPACGARRVHIHHTDPRHRVLRASAQPPAPTPLRPPAALGVPATAYTPPQPAAA